MCLLRLLAALDILTSDFIMSIYIIADTPCWVPDTLDFALAVCVLGGFTSPSDRHYRMCVYVHRWASVLLDPDLELQHMFLALYQIE